MAVLRADRGTLPAPQPILSSLSFPHPHRGSCLASSWCVQALGLGGFPAHPVPHSSIPCRGTYMAHCSFSFLMEPYNACREKSGGQQDRGARLGVCSREQRRHARLAQGLWRLR